MALKARVGVVD